MYEIIPTTDEHVVELSTTMREADVQEVWAANHLLPYEALKLSLEYTDRAYTSLFNKEVICMWGVGKTTYLSEEGIPWMLTSDLVRIHFREFLRQAPRLLDDIKKEAIILINMVDARNTLSIRWLKWLGFTIHDSIPFGPDNMLFHPFSMSNK